MNREPPDPRQLAALYKAIFSTDARGRTVLENLEKLYARPAVVKGGIDAVLETYLRIGQREMLDHIHTQIARADAEPQETPVAKT